MNIEEHIRNELILTKNKLMAEIKEHFQEIINSLVTKHDIENIVFNFMMNATKSLILEQWKNEHIKNEIENQIKKLMGK